MQVLAARQGRQRAVPQGTRSAGGTGHWAAGRLTGGRSGCSGGRPRHSLAIVRDASVSGTLPVTSGQETLIDQLTTSTRSSYKLDGWRTGSMRQFSYRVAGQGVLWPASSIPHHQQATTPLVSIIKVRSEIGPSGFRLQAKTESARRILNVFYRNIPGVQHLTGQVAIALGRSDPGGKQTTPAGYFQVRNVEDYRARTRVVVRFQTSVRWQQTEEHANSAGQADPNPTRPWTNAQRLRSASAA